MTNKVYLVEECYYNPKNHLVGTSEVVKAFTSLNKAKECANKLNELNKNENIRYFVNTQMLDDIWPTEDFIISRQDERLRRNGL